MAAYECPLSEDVRAVARAELREDEATREHALSSMRDWISKHARIRKCRTDSVFLLRFLRTKKFSIPMAQELLERYLVTRQLHPQWFRGLHCDEKVMELLGTGYIFALPETDELGRRVCFVNAGRPDPSRFTSPDVFRTLMAATEVLLEDEQSQVCGFVFVNELSELTARHMARTSPGDITRLSRCQQNCTPMRQKVAHFVGMPALAAVLMDLVLRLLSDKLRARVKFHNGVADLHKHIDPKILPKEYGGTVPAAEMIASFTKDVLERTAALQALDDIQIEVDSNGAFAKELQDEMAGSFRKLDID